MPPAVLLRGPRASQVTLAFVNAWAIRSILVGTPIAALAFDLPTGASRSRALAAACAAALTMVGRVPFEEAAAVPPRLGRRQHEALLAKPSHGADNPSFTE